MKSTTRNYSNEIEIFSENENSYFDKYLNEVLYLFENSDFDVFVPNENLTAPCATSSATPIACKTCDGSKDFDVQADEVETQIPAKSNNINTDSPSIP